MSEINNYEGMNNSPSPSNLSSIARYFNHYTDGKPFESEGSSSMNDCFKLLLEDNEEKNKLKALAAAAKQDNQSYPYRFFIKSSQILLAICSFL